MQYSISFESSATNEIADQHSRTFISQRGDKSCFDSIRSKIDHYEYLKNAFLLLELALLEINNNQTIWPNH